tara:strand:+ start:218 stop:673 length:456 start_codon:yes stop_codon:yes gene_type:complete
MDIALNNTELIHLYLKEFIHEPQIRKIIIHHKITMENKHNIQYHIERWNTIVGAFFYTKDNQSSFSLVYNNNNKHSQIFFSTNKPPQYIIVPDHIKDFYNITNTSYQSWELLFELIKTYYTYGKHHAHQDDILYSQLSRKIYLHMKLNNTT